ncbi:MAG: hypothetical protein JSV03_01515, partial [Planctomycetota bacterium]
MNHGKKTYTRRETLHLSVSGALATMGAINNTATGKKDTSNLSEKNTSIAPPVKTRMFWTWDHTTEWMLNRPGAQTIGASNYYGRTKECFVGDYTKMLEFCGQHNINGVIVWGLLRDRHGGLESASQLCEVAAKNGVSLLCGAGLCAYGGVYYQGDSPYSLDLHLQKHPELKAVDDSGKPLEFTAGIYGPKMFYHACPSRKENQEHIAESLQWLFENLPLDGVQIEAGDNHVCQCKLCKDRRRYPTGRFSWEDMALLHPIAIKAIRAVKPDAWICCETYSHPEPYRGQEHPGFGDGKTAWADQCLAKIPDGVFIEWVYDRIGKSRPKRIWTKAGNVNNQRHRHIMRAHFSTYWSGIRGELAIEAIAEMVQESMDHGSDVISLFGEVSPFHTGAELNYLALENFGSSANPKADVNIFLRDVAAPLL